VDDGAKLSEAEKAEQRMRQAMKHSEDEQMQAMDDTKMVPLCEDVPSKAVTIGTEMPATKEARLLEFIRNNQDVFALASTDLTGVRMCIDLTELNKQWYMIIILTLLKQ
jgi:hypothetical protein